MAKKSYDRTRALITISDKGGIGKTQISSAIAHTLGTMGYRVLVIDAEHQGDISRSFGFTKPKDISKTLFAALNQVWVNNGSVDITGFIERTDYENIDILLSDPRLSSMILIMIQCASDKNAVNLFGTLLDSARGLQKYHFIIIDTHPQQLGEFQKLLVSPCDYVLTPVDASLNSNVGGSNIINVVESLQKEGSTVKMLGLFLNKVVPSREIYKTNVPELREQFGDVVFKTEIRNSEDVIKSENLLAPVTDAYPNGRASINIRALVKEGLKRIEQIEKS